MKIKKEYNHICAWCEQPFVSFKENSKFCSTNCVIRGINFFKDVPQSRECPICSSNFIPSTQLQIYCSRSCSYRKSDISGGTKNIKFYSTPCLCKCGCGQVIMNPDDHHRWRKFIPEHRNAGGTHPRKGVIEPEDHIEMRIRNALAAQNNKETSIETQLYDYLSNLGVEYEKQKQVGRTRPDAFIPQLNLCIYADGAYWHTRSKDIERDKRANACVLSHGLSYIRIVGDKNNVLNLRPLKQYLLQNFNLLYSGAMA